MRLTLFGPVIDHLREVGETRSCTEIEAYFKRNFDVSGVITACEYLADQGLIGKASTPVHLTKKSNIEVQELAFFSMTEPPDGSNTAGNGTARRPTLCLPSLPEGAGKVERAGPG